MWDLSSLTGIECKLAAVGAQSPNRWAPGKRQTLLLFCKLGNFTFFSHGFFIYRINKMIVLMS